MKKTLFVAAVFLACSFGKLAFSEKVLTFENAPLTFHKSTGQPAVAHNKEEGKPEVPGSVLELISETFPEQAAVMVAVAKAESSLNPLAASITDKMADGRSFSYGLFQLNITVSVIDGVDCSKAFSGRDYAAVVVDEALFSRCIELATDIEKNLAAARKKFDSSRGLAHWGAYTSGAWKNYL